MRVTGDLFHPVVPAGAVYVGRGGPSLPASRFENRHRIGSDCRICGSGHDQPGAVAAYADDLDSSPELVAAVRTELAGADLACWCRPGTGPCHGDVLRFVAAGVDPLAAHLTCVLEHQGHPGDVSVVLGLAQVLSGVCGPTFPADGDCLIWQPQVHTTATAAGFPAQSALVTGWLDEQSQTMAFLHHATIVTLADHLIVVDLTAQQFAHHLPRRWFATDATYRARLAKATKCSDVSITATTGPRQ